MFRPYSVPGQKVILAQPSGMSCWATVYTMLISWRQQRCIEISTAVADLGQKWLDYFNDDNGLPGSEGQNFERVAGIVREPRMNYSLEGWSEMLQNYGLLWVSKAGLTQAGRIYLHDRVVHSISGDGETQSTFMGIIDPDGGRQYQERFDVFLRDYERQADPDHFPDAVFYNDYQVLHFR